MSERAIELRRESERRDFLVMIKGRVCCRREDKGAVFKVAQREREREERERDEEKDSFPWAAKDSSPLVFWVTTVFGSVTDSFSYGPR